MEKIINILSVQFDIDPEIVEKIVRSEFNFIKATMEQGEFQSVHLHYLGKFAVKEGRLKQLQQYGEYKDPRSGV